MSKIRPLTTTTTYSLAHTAQCKLKLSANRPDRNLRFVLGHAFTLDNLMLRIVEIENRSAKSDFLEGKPPSEDGFTHYDCSAAAAKPAASAHPEPPKPDVSKTTASVEEPSGGRRISFHDNNARPSKITPNSHTNSGTNSPARNRSPPPPIHTKHEYLDDSSSEDGTSSDDYDEPNSYIPSIDANAEPSSTHTKHHRPQPDAYSHEEDAALELADDELDDPLADDFDSGLSLQRFESASARPPRMVRSGSSSSEDEDDDDNGPVSPPQLPVDLDVRELIEGEKDEELAGLYDSVKNCACHGQVDDAELAHEPTAFWDIPEDKTGGKRLAIVAVAAAA